jgi:hypothetical protein
MGGIGMGKTAVKRFHCRLPAKPGLLFSAGVLRRGGLRSSSSHSPFLLFLLLVLRNSLSFGRRIQLSWISLWVSLCVNCLLVFSGYLVFLGLVQICSTSCKRVLGFIQKCAMAVAYASASSAVGKQRRPAPRRGQVKAAIAASWLNALTSIVYGARSVALSRSNSRWSFRSS